MSRRSVWRLRLVVAILAVIGQVAVSASSLTLAREESSAVSHTEQNGVDLHHGHNDATCVACVALSFQATVNPVSQPVATGELIHVGSPADGTWHPASSQLLSNSCRAPPRES